MGILGGLLDNPIFLLLNVNNRYFTLGNVTVMLFFYFIEYMLNSEVDALVFIANFGFFLSAL